MVRTIEQLRAVSDEELIKEHDAGVEYVNVGLNYYREELARRDQDRQTQKMLDYTKQLWILTIIVTIATVLSLAISLIALFHQTPAPCH